MKNIEIKAKVHNVIELIKKAETLSDAPCKIIQQYDTFYKTLCGRLKLRKFEDESSELIYYERNDVEGPKLSNYDKIDIPANSTEQLNIILSKALGDIAVVKKKRQLFIIGQTRVHIDSVENLGDFMELEVVLGPHETPEQGVNIAYDLMSKLGVNKEDLISGAYADLLEKIK